ncbi:LysR family transcriptional regulator [Winogradskya humida]|uniref:LysR family transcriptional regulator n=1 Tax=Winogradskya humida TaxID=113566 RepID=A0ABQ3ZUS9_9ACTN|nr:LysR substrate-binding domain-containing protein [Actinoplanes humidus]GIE22318.1 LysR family transcriptional regulator [Actinoplanes humidus]
MELRQLEYLVAVAEEANFTRAAERVRISQSGVSAQIRQLEHELGAALIDRSGRRATVTAAGEVALRHARAALMAVQELRRGVDDVNGLVRGRLAVGMVTGCTITPFFDALARFHAAHPGIDLVLREDNSDELLNGVRAGAIDLALVGTATATPEGVQAMPIISEGLVALVPGGHPLAARQHSTLAEIAAYPVICLPRGTGIRTVFDQACAAGGVTPDIALQASAPAAIMDLARRGMGVAVLSASMATGSDLRALPIGDATEPAVLALTWPRTVSPALRELLHHCREAFND